MEKKIYPYLISEQQMNGYYEILLDKKYKLKIFDKKQEKVIYDTILPDIKDFMFWTYNVSNGQYSNVSKKEFEKMTNDLKATICGEYPCNIFEKDENIVVCFRSGICFAITSNENQAKKIKKFEAELQMREINLRDDDSYVIPNKAIDNDMYLYLYILELYKMIFMKKIHKDLQILGRFDKARNDFVKFIENVYNTKITDNEECEKICKEWEKELDLEKAHVMVDNEFDLLYKNNKMNGDKNIKIWVIVLIITAIIIGIINLWGMMQ